MVTIKLTEEQLKNLDEFISRTSLSGREVPAFISLINALKRKEFVKENIKDENTDSSDWICGCSSM